MAHQHGIDLSSADRARLEAVVADRNGPQEQVSRARIILLAAAGLSVRAVGRQIGKTQPTVRRWRRRFGAAGVDGLLRDKIRPPGKVTHWTVRAMAHPGTYLRSGWRIGAHALARGLLSGRQRRLGTGAGGRSVGRSDRSATE